MKIKVTYQGGTEEIKMQKIKDFDSKSGEFKTIIVNFGGRLLPF